MTALRMLMSPTPPGYDTYAYRFGGTITSSLIISVDCLISTIEGAFLAAVIQKAGPGDYIETGCGFGGSAILAALTKKVFAAPGKVVTIDIFANSIRTYEVASKNIAGYGLEHSVELIKASSDPWPLSKDRKFVVGLVDGAHQGDIPYRDLVSMSKCVEKYILLHDYDTTSPFVVQGAHRFADEHPEWIPLPGKKRMVVFAKRAV